jgi:hypothetical protein
VLFAALLLVVLAIGIALGMALHDNPRPGGTVTTERTVELTGSQTGTK